jgi:hypothetical protein
VNVDGLRRDPDTILLLGSFSRAGRTRIVEPRGDES